MLGWTSSPGGADYRGFTHRQSHYQGFAHPAESISGRWYAASNGEQPLSLWITHPASRFPGTFESGFHPLLLRGFTHRSIGVSPTESRGFTHQAVSQAIEPQSKSPLFLHLNLLNDSYLTESLNPTAQVKRQ